MFLISNTFEKKFSCKLQLVFILKTKIFSGLTKTPSILFNVYVSLSFSDIFSSNQPRMVLYSSGCAREPFRQRFPIAMMPKTPPPRTYVSLSLSNIFNRTEGTFLPINSTCQFRKWFPIVSDRSTASRIVSCSRLFLRWNLSKRCGCAFLYRGT